MLPDAALEVFYQERELTETQKILMSPDRSPNFRGARDMGVGSNGGGFDALMQKLIAGNFSGAFVVGEDLIGANGDGEKMRGALAETFFSRRARYAHDGDREAGSRGFAGSCISARKKALTPTARGGCKNSTPR